MDKLKDFRKANGLSQTELADALGIGQGFISQIEKGRRPAPADIVKKILHNEKGWDISALSEEFNLTRDLGNDNAHEGFGDSHRSRTETELAVLRKEVEMLRAQLRDKDEQIEFLKSLIK